MCDCVCGCVDVCSWVGICPSNYNKDIHRTIVFTSVINAHASGVLTLSDAILDPVRNLYMLRRYILHYMITHHINQGTTSIDSSNLAHC